MMKKTKKPKKVKTRFDTITERQFTKQVIDLAGWYGWLRFHQLPGMSKSGRWLSATQGDIGWPDLFLVHPKRCQIVIAELKTEAGRLTPGQELWLDAITGCWDRLLERNDNLTLRVFLWTPSQSDDIEAVLKG